MPRRLPVQLLCLACLTLTAAELQAQSVVLRTAGVGSDGSSGSSQWMQGVSSGRGALGTGTTLERLGDRSRQEIGVGLGEMTALSVRSAWYGIPRIDSLVLGDIDVISSHRGALPGPSLGSRTALGIMLALPAWSTATLRVAAGSVAPRAHAGGVSGIALQSHRPRSALLRSADFGEPECSAGASWTCALASVALSQRLPRSAHLTTSASLTSELSGGGSIARGEAMLNGGVHRVRSVTLQPGTALQLGPSPGASAWSRIEHANGGIYLRISQGRMLRPALRVVGADDARVLAPEFLQRWERIAARQGSLDARWTPADWLRAGAGFRVWHERSLGITGRGALDPDAMLDPMATVDAASTDGFVVAGATRGHHAAASLAVINGDWQGSASVALWRHEALERPESAEFRQAAAGLAGRDYGVSLARHDSFGRQWRVTAALMDGSSSRRARLTTGLDHPLGLRGTLSAGALLRWNERFGTVVAPTAQLRWMLPFGQVGVHAQLPLGSGADARAERWVGGTAEFNLGRWIASVSQVHTASGLVWRLSARRAWRGSAATESASYERAARGALWIHGRVLRSSGEPLVALPVHVGDAVAFTDDEGRFSIRVESIREPQVRLGFDAYPGGSVLQVISSPDRMEPVPEAMPRAGAEGVWLVERMPGVR